MSLPMLNILLRRRLRPGELAQSVFAVEAAEAAVTDAAERQRRDADERQHRVDGRAAGLHPVGDACDRCSSRTPTSPDPNSVALAQPHRLVRVPHGVDHHHRAERLLLHGGGLLRHVDQHDRVDVGRLDRVGAADQCGRATLQRVARRAGGRCRSATAASSARSCPVSACPAVTCSALAFTLARKSSRTACTTYTRSTPTHAWPAFHIEPQTIALAAASRSASSATMVASLPPSSSNTGVRFSAQACITRRPVGTDPVNAILSMPDLHSADARLTESADPGDEPLGRVRVGQVERLDGVDAGRGGELARLDDGGVARGQRVGRARRTRCTAGRSTAR